MSKIIDIRGRKFGLLTALELLGKDQYNQAIWKCNCDCGAVVQRLGTHLRTGNVKSCGCLRRSYAINLTGQRFGRLVAVKPTDQRTNSGCVIWECRCDCGVTKECSMRLLQSGQSRSCGCLQREIASQVNSIDITHRRFNRLLAIRPTKRRSTGGSILWECVCDCGIAVECSANSLKTGNTASCGCWKRQDSSERLSKMLTTHGLSHTKEYRRRYRSRCRIARLQRTPDWADREAIHVFYQACPIGFQVDHIIPLRGKLVSGLHVRGNLQYLSASENSRKHNKFEPEIIEASTGIAW